MKPNAWYGYRRDARDPRDHLFKRTARRLPAKVDLRADIPPVLDQGALGSCVLNSTTEAMRYCLIKAGKPAPALSRLQIYYDTRKIEGSLSEDAGCEIRDAIKSANKTGVGRETLWPYRVAKFAQKPPAAVYADASNFNAVEYRRVTVAIADIKAALAAGLPVIIGVTVFDSFESAAVERTGVVPMPNLKKESTVGGHSMLAVGYGQRAGFITVRNSWGTTWGDSGDCYLPEGYIGSIKYGGDYWVVSLVG